MATSTVLLIHGLAASPVVFWRLARTLRSAGKEVVFHRYPSCWKSIDEHVDDLQRHVNSILQTQNDSLSIIGHSLGGILAAEMLARSELSGISQFISIASPHRGSHVARWMSQQRVFRWCTPLVELAENQDGLNLLSNRQTRVRSVEELNLAASQICNLSANKDRVIRPGNAIMNDVIHHAVTPGGHIDTLFFHETQQQVLRFLNHGTLRSDAYPNAVV
ncbi:MAG: alpha/beta fold hydrolase [Pirellulaceae bacterium]